MEEMEMNYILTTNRGVTVNFESEDFDPAAYVENLNIPTMNTLAIMNMVIQKNNIQSIVPVRQEGELAPSGTEIKILTNNGDYITAYVSDYSATEVSADFNNNQTTFVLLGDIIIHRHHANMITVV